MDIHVHGEIGIDVADYEIQDYIDYARKHFGVDTERLDIKVSKDSVKITAYPEGPRTATLERRRIS